MQRKSAETDTLPLQDYAGKVETSGFRFYIRLIVRRNDYNFYVFAYEAAVDEALEGAAEKEEKPV